MKPNLTVVIPCHDSKFLEIIINKIHNFFDEIIVVGTSNLNLKKFPNVIFFEKNKFNASSARNFGASRAKNDYIFFLDSDCLPDDIFLTKVLELNLEPKKILSGLYYVKNIKENFISNIYSIFISKRLKKQNSVFVTFSSAAFIINKNFFEEVGMFNENMRTYEDVDFSVRANLFHAQIEFLDSFKILHLKNYNIFSLVKDCFFKSYYGMSNILQNFSYFKNNGLNVQVVNYLIIVPYFFLLLTIKNPVAGFLLFLISLIASVFLFKKNFGNFFISFFANIINAIIIFSMIVGSIIACVFFIIRLAKFIFIEFFDYLILLKRVIVKSKYPVQIIQYVTARCNLRCDHCFYKETLDAKDPGEMSIEEIISNTNNISPFLWYSITGGEVFVRKDFSSLVLNIQKYLRPKFFSLPTNGWYLKRTYEGVLNALQGMSRGNLILFFSVDGPELIHDKIRGKNSFKRLKDTFLKLKKLKTLYPRLDLNIVITVQNENHSIFPDFLYNLQKEFDPTAISINLLRYHSTHSPKLDEQVVKAYEKAVNEYNSRIRMRNKYNFFMSRIIKAKDENQKNIILNAVKHDRFTTYCSAGNLSYVIMENGNVKPCEILDDVYGNIIKQPINSTINSKSSIVNRKWIKSEKCRCTYECANSTNALFNFDMLPGLIKTICKDFVKKKN